MPDNWMTGRTLAALRVAHGWTQAELAERSGVDKSQISRYERNEGRPTFRTLERLAEALLLEVYELRRWEEDLSELVGRTTPGPPPRPAPPMVDWPFPIGRMPWETEGDEGPLDEGPRDGPEVNRLAREAGRLAERFVRLHFRHLQDRRDQP